MVEVRSTVRVPRFEELHYPFEFRGQAGEYFRIWIVNIALTLLTLGIYSAWAKVRTQRYFCANTYLDGSNFEYLASPMAILKGRLIAVALFIVYWVITHFMPLLALPAMLVFVIAMPWIIARAMAFRARNTAWRNVRFGFAGGYGDVVKAFILWPMLLPFTFGLIWPFVHYKQKQLLVAKSEFGDQSFAFNAEPKQFYQVYAIAFVMLMVIPLGTAMMGGLLGGVVSNQAGGEASPAVMVLPMLMALVSVGIYYLVYVFVNTRLANLVFNTSSVGEARLESNLSVRALMWIYFTNALAIAATAGLMVPWARVRLARYRAEQSSVHSMSELDGYRAVAGQGISALGEEAGEIFDVGISI